ncbi:MAG TPA: type I restriction enzyme HsdR N-terminal domain-containing protein [Balneolales bacterium]|nr:type I restriction enzyme HsdR N-terminal domain-containing protein [Balneolales bacterium]
MRSVASQHFPRVVFRNGEKLLWNPLVKRSFANRPEERVRLRLLDHLLLERNWSPHRITTEHAISINHKEAKKRADIVCFNQDFSPRLLIECKAENISLNESTGQQIARYNSKIKSPYLMLSNGINDHLFSIDSKENLKRLDNWPETLPNESISINRTFSYWADRGFVGQKTEPHLRNWISDVQSWFWIKAPLDEQTQKITYLVLKQSPTQLNMEHYYKVFILSQYSMKVAVSFIATAFGGNRLVAIINKNGHNEGIIEVNLDLMAKDIKPNAITYSSNGEEGMDVRDFLSFDFEIFEQNQLQDLPEKFIQLFNHINS